MGYFERWGSQGVQHIKGRGFSILETILAVTLLTTAMLLFFRLFHISMTYSTAIEKRILATSVATRQLNKLRGWAHSPDGGGFNFDDWSLYTDTTFPDEEHPEFTVRIRSEAQTLVSPSTSLGAGGTGHNMTQSARKVQATVTWAGGQIELVSLVADPTRRLRAANPLVLSGAPSSSLPRDGTADFSVQAFDNNGREIPDLTFRWYVLPMTGNGTVDPFEASTTTFKNVYGLDQDVYTGGECGIRARCVYRGQEGQGDHSPIVLDP